MSMLPVLTDNNCDANRPAELFRELTKSKSNWKALSTKILALYHENKKNPRIATPLGLGLFKLDALHVGAALRREALGIQLCSRRTDFCAIYLPASNSVILFNWVCRMGGAVGMVRPAIKFSTVEPFVQQTVIKFTKMGGSYKYANNRERARQLSLQAKEDASFDSSALAASNGIIAKKLAATMKEIDILRAYSSDQGLRMILDEQTVEPATFNLSYRVCHLMVLPFLTGGTVGKLPAPSTPPQVQTRIRYIRELFHALDSLTRLGIAHRDLHSGNVMLERDHPVIIDFGMGETAISIKERTDRGLSKPFAGAQGTWGPCLATKEVLSLTVDSGYIRNREFALNTGTAPERLRRYQANDIHAACILALKLLGMNTSPYNEYATAPSARQESSDADAGEHAPVAGIKVVDVKSVKVLATMLRERTALLIEDANNHFSADDAAARCWPTIRAMLQNPGRAHHQAGRLFATRHVDRASEHAGNASRNTHPMSAAAGSDAPKLPRAKQESSGSSREKTASGNSAQSTPACTMATSS